MTQEFFQLCRSRLSVDDKGEVRGVLAANIITSIEGPRAKMFRAAWRVFTDPATGWLDRQVYIVRKSYSPGGSNTEAENVIFLLTPDAPRLDKAAFHARADAFVKTRCAGLPPSVFGLGGERLIAEFADKLMSLREVPEKAGNTGEATPLLTDDYCPVEFMHYSLFGKAD
jgi:hypothetical protein